MRFLWLFWWHLVWPPPVIAPLARPAPEASTMRGHWAAQNAIETTAWIWTKFGALAAEKALNHKPGHRIAPA